MRSSMKERRILKSCVSVGLLNIVVNHLTALYVLILMCLRLGGFKKCYSKYL
jgi:hypothetical protein